MGSPSAASALMTAERKFAARNYDPLPVVLSHGQGAWITDVDGRRYLDLMSAYSAVSFGHANPTILATLVTQAQQLAVTSRAFFNDRLPLLLERVTRFTGLPRAMACGLISVSGRKGIGPADARKVRADC